MKNMKKILGLIFITSILFAACSKSPDVYKGNTHKKNTHKEKVYNKKKSISIKREKIDLEYSAFKKLGLPLPENNYGKRIDYLIPVNENFDENFSLFKKYNESKALKFFKNRNITGYGDNSSYWRWKTSIKKSEWYNNVRKKVYTIAKSNYRNVFILRGNKWVHKKIGKLARVKNVKIIARGPSGIVTHILVETTRNKFLITKEWNIRKIFATH
ncbi:MAG: stage II sporulation protein SpoIID, partial [Fusobacteriales bacterium]